MRWKKSVSVISVGQLSLVLTRTFDRPGGVGLLEGQPKKGSRGWSNKNVVLTPVERDGSARGFQVDAARIGHLQPIIRENLSREANLMADEMYS